MADLNRNEQQRIRHLLETELDDIREEIDDMQKETSKIQKGLERNSNRIEKVRNEVFNILGLNEQEDTIRKESVIPNNPSIQKKQQVRT